MLSTPSGACLPPEPRLAWKRLFSHTAFIILCRRAQDDEPCSANRLPDDAPSSCSQSARERTDHRCRTSSHVGTSATWRRPQTKTAFDPQAAIGAPCDLTPVVIAASCALSATLANVGLLHRLVS